MRDRDSEFEFMGAEAMPANFICIDRVVRMGREDALMNQQPRRQFQPLGLVQIIARWRENAADQ